MVLFRSTLCKSRTLRVRAALLFASLACVIGCESSLDLETARSSSAGSAETLPGPAFDYRIIARFGKDSAVVAAIAPIFTAPPLFIPWIGAQ